MNKIVQGYVRATGKRGGTFYKSYSNPQEYDRARQEFKQFQSQQAGVLQSYWGSGGGRAAEEYSRSTTGVKELQQEQQKVNLQTSNNVNERTVQTREGGVSTAYPELYKSVNNKVPDVFVNKEYYKREYNVPKTIVQEKIQQTKSNLTPTLEIPSQIKPRGYVYATPERTITSGEGYQINAKEKIKQTKIPSVWSLVTPGGSSKVVTETYLSSEIKEVPSVWLKQKGAEVEYKYKYDKDSGIFKKGALATGAVAAGATRAVYGFISNPVESVLFPFKYATSSKVRKQTSSYFSKELKQRPLGLLGETGGIILTGKAIKGVERKVSAPESISVETQSRGAKVSEVLTDEGKYDIFGGITRLEETVTMKGGKTVTRPLEVSFISSVKKKGENVFISDVLSEGGGVKVKGAALGKTYEGGKIATEEFTSTLETNKGKIDWLSGKGETIKKGEITLKEPSTLKGYGLNIFPEGTKLSYYEGLAFGKFLFERRGRKFTSPTEKYSQITSKVGLIETPRIPVLDLRSRTFKISEPKIMKGGSLKPRGGDLSSSKAMVYSKLEPKTKPLTSMELKKIEEGYFPSTLIEAQAQQVLTETRPVQKGKTIIGITKKETGSMDQGKTSQSMVMYEVKQAPKVISKTTVEPKQTLGINLKQLQESNLVGLEKQITPQKQVELLKQPTVQLERTAVALKQAPIQMEVQRQQQKQTQKQIQQQVIKQTSLPRLTTAKITPLIPTPGEPSRGTFGGFPSKQTTGFEVFIRRRGKFMKLAGIYSKGEALKKGEYVAKQTLAATFKVVPSKRKVIGQDIKFIPSQKEFRSYKISKGQRIPLEDTYIQKRGFRLSTLGEKSEIRASKGFFKGSSSKNKKSRRKNAKTSKTKSLFYKNR